LVDGKLPEVKLDVKLLENDRRGEVFKHWQLHRRRENGRGEYLRFARWCSAELLKSSECEYIAMETRIWDADVLPLAEATGAGWKINLPAGISRQIWLDFNVDAKDCPPGTHQGNVEIQVQGGPNFRCLLR